jgi:HEAT repeat protein
MSERFNDHEGEREKSFASVLSDLESGKESSLIAGILEGLSGLSPEQLARLKPIWDKLNASYRLLLMQMLIDASQHDTLLIYDDLGIMNLDAAEAEIRKTAIEMLVYTQSYSLMEKLLNMAQHDEGLEVRIEAVKELGRFVLLGEYEEIPENWAKKIQLVLLDIHKAQANDLNLRRFALESLANATSDEIISLIEAAYHSNHVLLQISAIVAMGNSCDLRWESSVLQELENTDTDFRREAVRAAGSIQSEEAVPRIIEILAEDDLDSDERDWIIWALGEIGGEKATDILDILHEKAQADEDEDLVYLIEDAINNAILAGDLMMLDFSDYDDLAFEDDED